MTQLVHPDRICRDCGTWLFFDQRTMEAATEYDGQVMEQPGVCPECDSRDVQPVGSGR